MIGLLAPCLGAEAIMGIVDAQVNFLHSVYLSRVIHTQKVIEADYCDYLHSPEVLKLSVFTRLSCAYIKDIARGTKLKEEDIHMIANGEGLSWEHGKELIGKVLYKSVKENEFLHQKNVIRKVITND